MKNKKTHEEIMKEYRALPDMMRGVIRKTAVMELQNWDVEEIGTSDVNCQIVSLYGCFGDWDKILLHGLDLCRK